jgi:hypothetical protein
LRIAAAALHVVIHQVVVHGIEHDLRDLCAGGIVEKYKRARLLERDELGAQSLHGKARCVLPRCPCIRVRIHVRNSARSPARAATKDSTSCSEL